MYLEITDLSEGCCSWSYCHIVANLCLSFIVLGRSFIIYFHVCWEI